MNAGLTGSAAGRRELEAKSEIKIAEDSMTRWLPGVDRFIACIPIFAKAGDIHFQVLIF
jgi:hypothetical protein